MDYTFYHVCIPEPTTILGVRLRPLSLGHLVILHRLKSAFVTPDVELTPHDLALSVLVCSGTYEEGLQLFDNPPSPRQFTRWFWKLARPAWLQKLGMRKPSMVDIGRKYQEFSEYINRGMASPYYSYDVAEAVAIKCPSVQIVRVALMRDFGLSDSEIMDRPWALCQWDHVTLKAIAGQVRMTDRDEIKEAQELANRLYEKMNKERNGHS